MLFFFFNEIEMFSFESFLKMLRTVSHFFFKLNLFKSIHDRKIWFNIQNKLQFILTTPLTLFWW